MAYNRQKVQAAGTVFGRRLEIEHRAEDDQKAREGRAAMRKASLQALFDSAAESSRKTAHADAPTRPFKQRLVHWRGKAAYNREKRKEKLAEQGKKSWKGLKSGAKATGKFLRAHWKEILQITVVIARKCVSAHVGGIL
ncbi:hypothetical protein DACRYDRAFT_25251 [Dacryopinax primogenitus]|uniref:Uncharacterized protein n=1 Tax=Dacryopinax primogenitus (strain DJM 731) TaxID=1858805 RepID=M5FPK3_DACPD|nr:uncharacterized protein DACRYDRAFT_25251 [Dacryopinax primogenitus]EJT97128.1 hypothetical protein DACRYDRAFT_25251 [Dacryopinax primogenitus]